LSVVRVVRSRSLRWADHSSIGVLSTVARRCVWSRNLVNEKAKSLAGLQSERKIKKGKSEFTSVCGCNVQIVLCLEQRWADTRVKTIAHFRQLPSWRKTWNFLSTPLTLPWRCTKSVFWSTDNLISYATKCTKY
jgi:hypothetical protein